MVRVTRPPTLDLILVDSGFARLRRDRLARDEFLLAASGQNLRKLAKLIPLPSPNQD
jgi:hypothetical protein